MYIAIKDHFIQAVTSRAIRVAEISTPGPIIFLPELTEGILQGYDMDAELREVKRAFTVPEDFAIVSPRLAASRAMFDAERESFFLDSDELNLSAQERKILSDRYQRLSERVNNAYDIRELYILSLQMAKATSQTQTVAYPMSISSLGIKDEGRPPAVNPSPPAGNSLPKREAVLQTLTEAQPSGSHRLPVPKIDLSDVERSLTRLEVFLAARPAISWTETLIRFMQGHLELLQSTEISTIRTFQDLKDWLQANIGFDSSNRKMEKFKNIKQTVGESYGTLWLRIKAGYANCFPHRNSAEDYAFQKSQFFDALLEADVAHQLRLEDPPASNLINRAQAIKSALDRRQQTELNNINIQSPPAREDVNAKCPQCGGPHRERECEASDKQKSAWRRKCGTGKHWGTEDSAKGGRSADQRPGGNQRGDQRRNRKSQEKEDQKNNAEKKATLELNQVELSQLNTEANLWSFLSKN